MEKIYYGIINTIFGLCIPEFSPEKIIRISFFENQYNLNKFEKDTNFIRNDSQATKMLINLLNMNDEMKFALKGTDFQQKVWEALCQLPFGEMATYADIAKKVNKPKAVRAVANAIGANPIAYFIPCHRVIRSDGGIGGYRWGTKIKEKMQTWEKNNPPEKLISQFIIE